jgi:hypothetical protein
MAPEALVRAREAIARVDHLIGLLPLAERVVVRESVNRAGAQLVILTAEVYAQCSPEARRVFTACLAEIVRGRLDVEGGAL